jgi:hypothetical protein
MTTTKQPETTGGVVLRDEVAVNSYETEQRKHYAGRINAAWQKSVEGIIEAGMILNEAKAQLTPCEFSAMVKDDLQFTLRTAQRLLKIAEHPVIATHVSRLPPSWGTLYELAKLPPEVLEAKIEDGTVTPKLERKDVTAMVRETLGPRAPRARGEPPEFVAPDEVGPSLSGPVALARKLQSALNELDRANAHIEELESALETASAASSPMSEGLIAAVDSLASYLNNSERLRAVMYRNRMAPKLKEIITALLEAYKAHKIKATADRKAL